MDWNSFFQEITFYNFSLSSDIKKNAESGACGVFELCKVGE